jgi:Adenylate and Guanylate cyclase catalytic domain
LVLFEQQSPTLPDLQPGHRCAIPTKYVYRALGLDTLISLSLAQPLLPLQVFLLLESVFQAFDVLAKKRGIYKVETIGDCYVGA